MTYRSGSNIALMSKYHSTSIGDVRRSMDGATCDVQRSDIPSKDTDVPLDDENLFLSKVAPQFFLESLHELAGFTGLARHDTVDDNVIPVSHAAESPESLIGLRKEGKRAKFVQELALKGAEFEGFN